MRAIQVIDGADNCTFSLFLVSEEEFATIFPNDQDIEFAEDIVARVGEEAWTQLTAHLWNRPILKSQAHGIHGTLFFEFGSKRHHFPNSKKEKDFDASMINPAQRRMFRGESQ